MEKAQAQTLVRDWAQTIDRENWPLAGKSSNAVMGEARTVLMEELTALLPDDVVAAAVWSDDGSRFIVAAAPSAAFIVEPRQEAEGAPVTTLVRRLPIYPQRDRVDVTTLAKQSFGDLVRESRWAFTIAGELITVKTVSSVSAMRTREHALADALARALGWEIPESMLG